MARPRPSITPRDRRLIAIAGPLGTSALVLIILAAAWFLVFRNASDRLSVTLKIGATGWGGAAIAACFACYLIDPGSPQPDPDDPGPEDEDNQLQRIRERNLPNGDAWKQKWCRDCHVWRPHRCGHCHVCERCVLRLDHHCGFMGACVGERNCRFFALFLFCAGMGIVHLVVLGFHRLADLRCLSDGAAWVTSWEPIVILLFLLCCPPVPVPICLAVQSLGLTCFGFGYSCLMLADTDVHGKGLQIRTELRNLLSCRGARTYCMGPLALKEEPHLQEDVREAMLDCFSC